MSLLKTMDDFHWPLHLIARQTVEVGGIRCNGGGGRRGNDDDVDDDDDDNWTCLDTQMNSLKVNQVN